MAALLASSVSRPIAVGSNAGHGVVRMGDQIDPDTMNAFQSSPSTMVSGFSLHANVPVEARDRMRLERLMRYSACPAVATDRLSELSDAGSTTAGARLFRLQLQGPTPIATRTVSPYGCYVKPSAAAGRRARRGYSPNTVH